MSRKLATKHVVDDLDVLIDVLPARVKRFLQDREDRSELLEIVLDLGRLPEARFPTSQLPISESEVTRDDIHQVLQLVGEFGDDNRAGIERTLHRISVIRNRGGTPVGLTCRVGRAVFGTIQIIQDSFMTGDSVLLLGRPGVGKTTMLREVARVLDEEVGRRVVIVDTSNEIAGDGNVPHPGIGHARRMQVARTELQHRVMIEAVENHMPEVIIIDEMSTELEALAARTIAERGVQLVATAHGNTLANVVSNPTLSDLVGGTQTVTLGDVEARRRRTQKTVLERRHEPTFDSVVEIRDRNLVGIHKDVGHVVDSMLRGYPIRPEIRWIDENGQVRSQVEQASESSGLNDLSPTGWSLPNFKGIRKTDSGRALTAKYRQESHSVSSTRVHPFGIPRSAINAAIDKLGSPVEVVPSADQADVFVTTKSHYSRRPTAVRQAEQHGTPVYVLRRSSSEQIRQFLMRFSSGIDRPPENNEPSEDGSRPLATAMTNAEEAVLRVQAGEHRVDLAPQTAYIRRLQHGLAARNNLGSSSTGQEPMRRVVIRSRKS